MSELVSERTSYHGVHYVPGMSDEQAARAARLDLPVLVAVLLTVPSLALHSADPDGALGVVSLVLNWSIWLTFLGETVLMLRLCPDDRAYVRHNKLDLVLLVVTPPFLPGVLQVLWILRLLRILDLLPVLGKVFRVNGFRYAATLAFLAVFGGGLAFAELESDQDGVNNGFDGVWWAWVTITTTGYGDLFPRTTEGRVLGMILMGIGPVLIGMIAGTATVLAERRIEAEVGVATAGIAGKVDEVEREVDEIEAQVGDVTAGVGSLRAVDEAILSALDGISKRLERLEKGTTE
ncbi:hypothetical protein DSM112329_02527 [Paraconexibacter sp. AEG42_29]|uniref:Potassium channel domain-containing protein n=1 Tax=Paraconexibacter sp. AEG42_29 TaxID=2997339 RepID=A0AAU7AW35_9ACTN